MLAAGARRRFPVSSSVVRRLLRYLTLAVVALLPSGCDTGRVEANVACQANQVGMTCSVSRISGTVDANACWDVKLSCRDGTASTAHACHPVPRGEAAASSRLIIWEDFARFADCGVPTSISVENLDITVN